MKKLLITSLGIFVIFLLILSLFSVEVISETSAKYCWTLKPGGPEPCWDKPTNCFCPIIVTPDGGAQ